MPRPRIADTALTNAERQARYRAAHAAAVPTRRQPTPIGRCSRAKSWHQAVAAIVALQAEYTAWLDRLPENLANSATAEALQEISDLDISELQAIAPPKGFGRD